MAFASFTLSFDNLRQLVVEQGVVDENISWLFPLVVDGAIVVYSMCSLGNSLKGQPTVKYRLLVAMATIASVLYNICHVDWSWLAVSLAATAPIFLFFSFEALVSSLKEGKEGGICLASAPVESLKKHETPKLSEMSSEERKKKVKDLHDTGYSVTEISQLMPFISVRTIQRDLDN